jgi:hypothetical protein
MKCWDDYISYLKDNPEGYWFKNKLYGYGWTPARPAGWITTLIYLVFLIGFCFYAQGSGLVEKSPAQFLSIVFGATALLIAICWRTGEPLKWQWGKEKNK